MYKILFTISAYLLMSAPLVFAQQKSLKSIPTTYYVEKNELQLSEAINKLRGKNELGELQLSPSLSFVARTHLNDIRLHSKEQHGCNLNSWSDKGKWTPCCFNGKQTNLDLMTVKPGEITGFRGKGYEIVIAAKKGVSAKNLTELWLSTPTTRDFLLSKGKWSRYNWQSMGVSIFNGFASLWLSEMPDRITDIPLEKAPVITTLKSDPVVHTTGKTVVVQQTVHPVTGENLAEAKPHPAKVSETEASEHAAKGSKTEANEYAAKAYRPAATESSAPKTSLPEQRMQTKSVPKPDQIVETQPAPAQDKGTSYFLVHSSYTSLRDAMKTFESLKKAGCMNLMMIDARGKYRVALGIYTNEAAAKTALHKNYPRFDQLKIYVF